MGELIQKYPITSIGMAIPGIINPSTGEVSGLSAIADREQVNFKTSFEVTFQVPVFFENDANCAAIGEVVHGAGKGFQDIAFFIIGTGLGGAIFIDRKLHRGVNSLGGEMGSMVYQKPNLDGWSNVSTKTGMFALEQFYENLSQVKKTGFEIYQAYETEKNAKAAIDWQISKIAEVILNTAYVIDPELVLLGGGVSQNPLFLQLLEDKLKTINHQIGMEVLFKIKACEFTNDANLIGAAALATL